MSCENQKPQEVKDVSIKNDVYQQAKLENTKQDSLDIFIIERENEDYVFQKKSTNDYEVVAVYDKCSYFGIGIWLGIVLAALMFCIFLGIIN